MCSSGPAQRFPEGQETVEKGWARAVRLARCRDRRDVRRVRRDTPRGFLNTRMASCAAAGSGGRAQQHRARRGGVAAMPRASSTRRGRPQKTEQRRRSTAGAVRRHHGILSSQSSGDERGRCIPPIGGGAWLAQRAQGALVSAAPCRPVDHGHRAVGQAAETPRDRAGRGPQSRRARRDAQRLPRSAVDAGRGRVRRRSLPGACARRCEHARFARSPSPSAEAGRVRPVAASLSTHKRRQRRRRGDARNLHELDAFARGDVFHVVVESPRGSAVKLKYDPKLWAIMVSRPLNLGIVSVRLGLRAVHARSRWRPDRCAGLLGSVELSGRRDPVPALAVDQGRPAGPEGKGRVRNDRVVAVPVEARREQHVAVPDDLPARVREELNQFFWRRRRRRAGGCAHSSAWGGPEADRVADSRRA